MKLYYAEASPPCRTVILVGKLVDVDLELILTSPKKGETSTPEFLQMNPQHVIPTLIDDTDGYHVIWESRAISKHLICKYAMSDDLYPLDHYKRIEVDKMLDFDLGTIFRRATDYFVTCLQTGKFDDNKKPKLNDALTVLNNILELNKSGFLCGNSITLADVSILPTITSLDVINYDLSKFPYIGKWLLNIKSLIPQYDVIGVKGELAFKQMVNEYLK